MARRPFEERPFRYLLITIHVNTEFVCQVMNRDVWNDALVQQIVKQNFVFLQLTDGIPEADRFISFYTIDMPASQLSPSSILGRGEGSGVGGQEVDLESDA